MEWCSHCLRFSQTRRETYSQGFSDEFCSSCTSCGKILSDSSGPFPISFQIRKRKHKSSGRKKRKEKSKHEHGSTSNDEIKDCATSSEEVKRKRATEDA